MRLRLPSMTYSKFLTKYYKPQTTISWLLFTCLYNKHRNAIRRYYES
jgi:hypothetical protein